MQALEPLPVRVHRMFGEYALYLDDRVVGFICDDTLLLKRVSEAAELTDGLPNGFPHPRSDPYALVDETLLADTDWLHETVLTIASTQPQKRKR